jgi:hypothetical protein
VGFAGRTQQYTVLPKGRGAWWHEIALWWPQWRQPRWPKLHGPATVHWARWPNRLPEYPIGPVTAVPLPPEPSTWVWATGADHLAALGRLIQPFDSDAWMSSSAWEALRGEAKTLNAPRDGHDWPGTRVSVIDDDHPLTRMLFARAGARHPAWPAAGLSLPHAQRTAILLDGLPLLDAIAAPDARVNEQGQAALTEFTARVLAP